MIELLALLVVLVALLVVAAAGKYTKACGTVTARAEKEADRLRILVSELRAEIAVKDNLTGALKEKNRRLSEQVKRMSER